MRASVGSVAQSCCQVWWTQQVGWLVFPTAEVRGSYLDGERELSTEEGADPAWLDRAAADFEGFVDRLLAPGRSWGVPVTQLWYVAGATYVGTVVIRRELTPELARVGGHIGYHVVPSHRRRGNAGRMLAGALVFCAHFGLRQVLLTCAPTNEASRKVIEANGGQPDGTADGELRYWIPTSAVR
ncbi:MAG TPA: GNAT family N-acetyltransferase [Mycobacteriales bacterium]|nr:GNAT family N-acetyltransferase [Mycobacteriales bacterium]